VAIEVAHPAPAAVQARWRALGAWTDETLLDRLAAADADRLALVDGDRRLTIAELRRDADRVAASLWARGVRPGDVVCWQLPNWHEAVTFCWGVWRCGAVASPITPTLRAREVGFVLQQTGARVVAVPASFRGTDYPALVRSTGFDGAVIVVRGDAAPVPDAPPPSVGVHVDDPAVVLWTSGTTSEPKGVVHTHQSLRCEADGIAAAHTMRAGDVLLLPMPVTHVAGLTYGVLLPVTLGSTAVLMGTWEPGEGLRLLAAERVGVMISTPVFLRSMVDHPDFAATDTSSLRLFSLGGAGVAPSMVREGAAAFGGPNGCWCKRTYGSTEYPTLTSGRAGDDPERDATTDGVVLGPAEIRIVEPGTERHVDAGQAGELLARGPEMFTGYLDRDLDADAFAPGGWFRTGDLATFDGTYLTIVDRLKDVIIRGGENISAAEVEGLLAVHPAISEAACVAMPDALMGERVCAFVIVRDGADVTLEALRAHLVEHGLARFKLPERLEVRTTLPRTASGKVQKSPLRDELALATPE
jgi:cyclohexanecarboxylate-CoA ligase